MPTPTAPWVIVLGPQGWSSRLGFSHSFLKPCPSFLVPHDVMFPDIFLANLDTLTLQGRVFLELSIPGCLLSLHAFHGQPYLFKPSSSLSSTDSVTSFPPSVLKTQILADPGSSYRLVWPSWTSNCLKPHSSSSRNKSCIPPSAVHLSEWNPRPPRHSQPNLEFVLEWPSLPHYSQSSPTSWLFWHPKPSPLLPLHFSYPCLRPSSAVHL